jgi:hypothetical protein
VLSLTKEVNHFKGLSNAGSILNAVIEGIKKYLKLAYSVLC